MLMHDTGKARRTGDHAQQSVELTESLFARLEFDTEERETVRRLIRGHLDMSAAHAPRHLRTRKPSAPSPKKCRSQQHLKMLTLMTYADIKAVSPDALTPWKAENLWQLYMSASNFLDRSVDEVRYHVAERSGHLQPHHRPRPRPRGKAARDSVFLEGLPQRYLQTRLPEQIRSHFKMAHRPAPKIPIQLSFRILRQFNEITLITTDRP